MDRRSGPRFVGPDLDPYCLKMSFKIFIFSEIVKKYFHFVLKLLEGTVYIDSNGKNNNKRIKNGNLQTIVNTGAANKYVQYSKA